MAALIREDVLSPLIGKIEWFKAKVLKRNHTHLLIGDVEHLTTGNMYHHSWVRITKEMSHLGKNKTIIFKGKAYSYIGLDENDKMTTKCGIRKISDIHIKKV